MKICTERARIQPYLEQADIGKLFSDPLSLHMQLREYAGDEAVLREGHELDGLYLQVEGLTKVTSSVETGKSLLLRFCRPLSIFGDIELIRKVAIQSAVVAVEPSLFLYIDKQTVERKLMKDCLFLNGLLQHLSYKLQTCTTASRVNLLATVEERLAIYLLTTRFPEHFGKEIQTPHLAEIASIIGTTPRHLNRVIHKLHVQGVFRKTRGSFVVLDWAALDRISNGLRYS